VSRTCRTGGKPDAACYEKKLLARQREKNFRPVCNSGPLALPKRFGKKCLG
jgi:hypothetical protein